MYKNYIGIIFFILTFAEGGRGYAQELPESLSPFVMPSARAAASGGYHAAYSSDFNVFFANPALLAGVKGQLSLADISLSFTDFGMSGLLTDFFMNTSQTSYINYFQAGKKNALAIGGPLGLGLLYKGWGIGAFNVTRMELVWTDDSPQRSRMIFTEDVFITGGYGFKFLDSGGATGELGIILKFFYREGYSPYVQIQNIRYFFENTAHEIFENQFGGGADAGLCFSFSGLSVGLTIHDPYSPGLVSEYANKEASAKGDSLTSGLVTVRPRLSAGLAWRLSAPFGVSSISDVVITLDYHNALIFLDAGARHPLLELSVGCEITLRDTVSFRMALDDMLPAAGIGINLGIFLLDAAIFLEECGKNLWEYPTLSFNVSLLYRYDFPFRQ